MQFFAAAMPLGPAPMTQTRWTLIALCSDRMRLRARSERGVAAQPVPCASATGGTISSSLRTGDSNSFWNSSPLIGLLNQ